MSRRQDATATVIVCSALIVFAICLIALCAPGAHAAGVVL
jgi:hypothetical protein